MAYIHWPPHASPAHPGQRIAELVGELAAAIVLELRRRRAARALRDLDARMLNDIGIRYDEIDRAVRFGRAGVLARRLTD